MREGSSMSIMDKIKTLVKEKNTAKIMGISRHRMATDGTGVTTLIGCSGCSLECKYCINDYCHINEGEDYTAEELLEYVSIDDIYFRMSNGGITFGGGEPLLQSKFIQEFAGIMPKGWKLNVETCFYVPWENIEPLIPLVDKWIIDVKDLNPDIYKKYTGRDIGLLNENLEKFYNQSDHNKIIFRIPDIPLYNSSNDVMNTARKLEKFHCDTDIFKYYTIQ